MQVIETERKYVIPRTIARELINGVEPTTIIQSYIPSVNPHNGAARIRILSGSPYAELTMKCPIHPTNHSSRQETTILVDLNVAGSLIGQLHASTIYKTRYMLTVDSPGIWTIDSYSEKYDGMYILEVEELQLGDITNLVIPSAWKAMDVTEDVNYTNYALAINGRVISVDSTGTSLDN